VSTPSGVQNERTSLSWIRTGLGLAGCALLTGRLAMLRDSPWAVVAAIACAVLGFGVLGWSHDRYRRAARAMRDERPVDHALPALLVTLAACLVGTFALVLIVL
jgi:putative membrane protein